MIHACSREIYFKRRSIRNNILDLYWHNYLSIPIHLSSNTMQAVVCSHMGRNTVHPENYTNGLRVATFTVLFLTFFIHFSQLHCPIADEVTRKNIGNHTTWIPKDWKYNYSHKDKQKPVHVFATYSKNTLLSDILVVWHLSLIHYRYMY